MAVAPRMIWDQKFIAPSAGRGHTKSQRSCMLCASRFGQSPFSCSFHFIMFAFAPVFLDELADAIAALAAALSAFDAQRVELTLDVAEDEIGPPRHDDDIITVL